MCLDVWWSRMFLFSLFGLFEEAYGRNTLEECFGEETPGE